MDFILTARNSAENVLKYVRVQLHDRFEKKSNVQEHRL